MKLTKTQQKLIDRAQWNGIGGRVAVSETYSNRTAKTYGKREYRAALDLLRMGLAKELHHTKETEYVKHGWMLETHYLSIQINEDLL